MYALWNALAVIAIWFGHLFGLVSETKTNEPSAAPIQQQQTTPSDSTSQPQSSNPDTSQPQTSNPDTSQPQSSTTITSQQTSSDPEPAPASAAVGAGSIIPATNWSFIQPSYPAGDGGDAAGQAHNYNQLVVSNGALTTGNFYSSSWWDVYTPVGMQLYGFQMYSDHQLNSTMTMNMWPNSGGLLDPNDPHPVIFDATAYCTEVSNMNGAGVSTWMLSQNPYLNANQTYSFQAPNGIGGSVYGDVIMPDGLRSYGPFPPSGDGPFYPYFVLLFM